MLPQNMLSFVTFFSKLNKTIQCAVMGILVLTIKFISQTLVVVLQ